MVELSELFIGYEPRTTIISQVLANFKVEVSTNYLAQQEIYDPTKDLTRTIYMDGFSNLKSSGIRMVIKLLEDKVIK